jgi:Kdo2-lipid IVA lauroyltransferase/acyltransferase
MRRHPLKQRLEGALVEGWTRVARAMPLERAQWWGSRAGGLAWRIGVRGAVARDNLRHAFPEMTTGEREAILRENYREMGRVLADYTRLGMVNAIPREELVSRVDGLEHVETARSRGRGILVLSGHFSSFELGVRAAAGSIPLTFMAKRIRNKHVEDWVARQRLDAGIRTIDVHRDVRPAYATLRDGGVVAMLADQDAGRRGVFVPFLGRPASTFLGPARMVLHTGATLLMGVPVREPDGRLRMEVSAPIDPEDPAAPDAAEQLTARHVAQLETWVRRDPSMWFWVHRRWKTRPPNLSRPVSGG